MDKKADNVKKKKFLTLITSDNKMILETVVYTYILN
jgi:hypothetical protein